MDGSRRDHGPVDEEFLRALPKAELHLHIEGTLEPELAFELAGRNGVELAYGSVEELRAAYEFDDLQSFLDIYYAVADVLRTEQDFHDLAWAYLQRAAADGVRRAEIFFDPQTHTERGIAYRTVLDGLTSALDRAGSELGLSTGLILCFLRHLSGDAALEILEEALPTADRLLGVGLDSAEVGNPPERFADAYAKARDAGLRVVAHAGEEGPPAYVWAALDELRVERIDHGVRALEDDDLVRRLVTEQVPLTMCPLSNVALRVVDDLGDHPLPRFLGAGALVSVNSDDPAYFGGYVGTNYVRTQGALGLDREAMVSIARNSIRSTFLPSGEKQELLDELDSYVAEDGT